MIPVRSSAIDAIGYDVTTKQLAIKFINNPISYTFYNVPFQVFNELMAAPSKGAYYHKYIEGRYRG
ncbi:KTSC domain-containing protein [Acinetobacter sp. Ac_5812]|uniref:KTSC domain-containing protein n=1 Tax=Acinetobacter sp. Ac_5812 TaxID=1848937 RepID=UPI00339D6F1C